MVRSSYYLSSPINYSVNSCLVYDRSSCEWRDEGDGRDQQVCKAISPYEGIWAADTQFHLRCAKWESQAYTHPLRYRFASSAMLNIKSAHSQTRATSRISLHLALTINLIGLN